MRHELLCIFLILAASRAVLAIVCFVSERARMGAEARRKLLHVGLGLLLCALPWIFNRVWPVAALCTMYVALLLARPYVVALDCRVTGVIYGVGRRSVGEFLFPLGVFVPFVLSRGEPALYLGPLLILTLADAAAALVGRRYGTCGYRTPSGGRKSLEGSLAFCVVAFGVTHFSLLLAGKVGRVESVLVAVCVATTLAVVEAVCVGGWDNLAVPLGAWGLMRWLAAMNSGALAVAAAGIFFAVMGIVCVYALMAAPGWEGAVVLDRSTNES
jgi:phytol kinase